MQLGFVDKRFVPGWEPIIAKDMLMLSAVLAQASIDYLLRDKPQVIMIAIMAH